MNFGLKFIYISPILDDKLDIRMKFGWEIIYIPTIQMINLIIRVRFCCTYNIAHIMSLIPYIYIIYSPINCSPDEINLCSDEKQANLDDITVFSG